MAESVLQKKGANSFIKLATPIFEHVYSELKKYQFNESIITNKVIRESVGQDLSKLIFPMIARVCVFELHSSSKNGFLKGDSPESRFNHFIELIEDRDIALHIINKYDVLKNNIETCIKTYIKFTCELYQRISNDYNIINSEFLQCSCSKVIKIESSGDIHNGKSVSIIIFGADLAEYKVVYKPRSLEIDTALNKLLEWFNSQTNITQHIQNYVDCGSYGWCEHVGKGSCKNNLDVKTFYKRFGGLLAITYMLRAEDLHYENIIAHGQFPVIIDTECFLQPEFKKGNYHLDSNRTFTTLHTSILPIRILASEENMGIDASGLLGSGNYQTPYQTITWENEGTDKMVATRKKQWINDTNNIAILNGDKVDPVNYIDDFILGFQTFYKIISKHKLFLLSEHSIINHFKNVLVRVVLRHTSEYGKLLYESYHPELLYFESKHKDHFNWLINEGLIYPELKNVFPYEYNELINGNIPIFQTYAQSKYLYNGLGEKIKIKVAQSGYEKLIDHIKNSFTEKDYRIQIDLIKKSIGAYTHNENIKQINQQCLADRSTIIVKNILDSMMSTRIQTDKVVTWATVESIGETLNPGFTGNNLYDGISGIGFVFLYAGVFLSEKKYISISKLIKNSIINYVDQNLMDLSVGAFFGTSGILYYLCHYYHFHQEEDVAFSIDRILDHIINSISTVNDIDITHGIAGCLIAVQSVHKRMHNQKINTIEQILQERLLDLYPNPAVNSTGKTTFNNLATCGFAHGVSGILYAILNSTTAPKSAKCKKWILDADSYLNTCYQEIQRDWSNYTRGDKHFTVNWCNGSPGIGRYYLTTTDKGNFQTAQNRLHSILSTIKKHAFNNRNHCLCHGNLGNFDFLIQTKLKFPELICKNHYITSAVKLVSGIEEDYTNTNFCSGISGLMTGKAGVAYGLLRLINPKFFPSVLNLEPPRDKSI